MKDLVPCLFLYLIAIIRGTIDGHCRLATGWNGPFTATTMRSARKIGLFQQD